jgi:transglutaminase-like putative cysteine protease/Ca2+/Na+ antiporter
MYDIRQFKPALYVLLLLGMTGFALAAQSPGIWLLAMTGTLLNAWLLRTDRFRPMPHLVASAVTLLSLFYLVMGVRAGTTPILLIGEFLVVLQLVKLFEQRTNRDYAQLLILSLLLMVAASINTASLLFGVMLIIYLFLSLYCCLLFHLKVEADQARKLISIPQEKINPMTLRQDQRFLNRSMRRLTGLISTVAITMAVVVFLFCPRLPTANFLGPLQFRPSQTLTGFSENVGFEQVAKITQNDAVVAHVTLEHNNVRVDGTVPLLLRGVTLSRYNGSGAQGGAAWSWDRARDPDLSLSCNDGENKSIFVSNAPERWVQKVSLYPTGSTVLFAMPGVLNFRPDRRVELAYAAGDETIKSSEAVLQALNYEVTSRGYVGVSAANQDERVQDSPTTSRNFQPRATNDPGNADWHSEIDPKIAEYAHDPNVTGSNATGPLWQQRTASAPPQAIDDLIASNIEKHLRSKFSYTLDLTYAARIAGQDPMVAFLYDLKRGHCEYFAGAMTLLCQSMGMKARMVVGFKCDDYNTLGGYYIVRQNHAHTWVEVQMPDSTWKSYDPTSGHEAARKAGLLATMKHAFDYLEYTWASNVIAYDRSRRDNMVMNVENRLTNTAIQTTDWVSRFRNWMNDHQNAVRDWLFNADRWYGTYQLLSFLTIFMIVSLLFAIGWFIFERWRLRLRALRIGIDALPSSQQLKLARQLGFYDDLLRVLERHGIYRPPHMTPLEFSESLSFLPAQAYDAVRRLTRIFYKIRYGGTQLHPPLQRRLALSLDHLESCLPAYK